MRKVFRQDNAEFIDILNEIRLGHCSDSTLEILRGRREQGNIVDPVVHTLVILWLDLVWVVFADVSLPANNGIVDTVLHTHKKAVDQLNLVQLQKLGAEVMGVIWLHPRKLRDSCTTLHSFMQYSRTCAQLQDADMEQFRSVDSGDANALKQVLLFQNLF